MGVKNVYPALHPRAPGSAGEERLIDQSACRMKSNTGHQYAPWDLLELSRSGNGSKRKIGGAYFDRAPCLGGKQAAVGRGSQIRSGGIGSGSDELIRRTRTPYSDGATGSGAEGNKNVIARGRALNKRRASETGNLRLRSRLNSWRAHREVHLSKACGTRAGRAAFAAETDEDGLRACSGNARRTRVGEAGNSADGHGCAGSFYWIEEIDILSAEIGDDELRALGSQSQPAQSGIRRRPAGSLERGEKYILLKIKNIDVIVVR